MKVLEQYADGSRTILFEPGDRVRFVRPILGWMEAEVGELGTVKRRDRPRVEGKPSSIDFLYVQTDYMRDNKYGTLHVAPWDVEFVEAGP